MKKILSIKYFLIFFAFSWTNGFCQNKSDQVIKNYLVKYETINFHILDSVFPFTLFIEPNGHYSFANEIDTPSNIWGTRVRVIDYRSKVLYRDTLVKKSDSILRINSFFPRLVKNDSSVINHYPYSYDPGISYEMIFSFILSNLKEPIVYNGNSKSIRVILPEELFGDPNKFISLRLVCGEPNKLVYSKGKFDSNSDLSLVQKDSCIVSQREIIKLNNLLDEIDFTNESYFIEVGPDIYPRYLLEYNDTNKYYVLARQFTLRNNKKDKELLRFVNKLISVAHKNIRINNWL